jgi:hypothetical protein
MRQVAGCRDTHGGDTARATPVCEIVHFMNWPVFCPLHELAYKSAQFIALIMKYAPLKRRSVLRRLHGSTSQKAVTFTDSNIWSVRHLNNITNGNVIMCVSLSVLTLQIA